MKKKMKSLASLIGATLVNQVASADEIANPGVNSEGDSPFSKLPIDQSLNTSVPLTLAAHRSHSSHGSHGSHRSSSTPMPSYPSSPSTAPPPAASPRSDPLGQPVKPKDTYDPAIPDAQRLKNDKALRKKVIEKVQMVLFLSGDYKGKIDGILGPETRDAIDLYKIKKGLKRGGYLDLETLNALGVSVY